MKTQHGPFVLVFVFACACALFLGVKPADAQLDPSIKSFVLMQHGEVVGEIYRGLDAAPPDSLHDYTEHWVLFANYKYPGARNNVRTEIIPNYQSYRDVNDFLARVAFPSGSKYVKVDSAELSAIPGR